MMVEIQWEMRDTATDREWVGSVNEMDVTTLAQASTWIRKQVSKHEHGTIEVDAVIISAIGDFCDDDGCPSNRKQLGSYEPASGEWNWAKDAQVS